VSKVSRVQSRSPKSTRQLTPPAPVSSTRLISTAATNTTADHPPLVAALGETEIGATSSNGGTKRPPSFKPPPQADLQLCTAFPGTPEWDKYWKNFNASMAKYTKEMTEYENGMKAFSDDLDRYKIQAGKINNELDILKRKDG
jgi:hypothetical protein